MKIAVLLNQVPDLAEELEVDDSGKAWTRNTLNSV